MLGFIYVIYKEGYKDLEVFNSYEEAIQAADERDGVDYLDSMTKENFINLLKTFV